MTRSANPRDGSREGRRDNSRTMSPSSRSLSSKCLSVTRLPPDCEPYGRGWSRVSFVLQMAQQVPQLQPGPVDVGLDRAEGQVERLGDLLVRAPLDVAQEDAGPVLGPELPDGQLDGRSQLPRP